MALEKRGMPERNERDKDRLGRFIPAGFSTAKAHGPEDSPAPTPMRQTLEFRLGQQLAMTPRMRQAIRLLRLSTLELRSELGQILESNYMLETDDEPARAERGAEIIGGRGASDPDSLPEPEESLRDRLHWQLATARFTERDRLIGAVIIDSIDERGYLEISMAELLAALEHLGLRAEPGEVEAVLARVQRFDPPGVAARSLSECLVRQLEETAPDTPHRDLAMRIARHHLEAIARRDYAGLAHRLEAARAELEAAHALLRSLNPRPGAGYAGTPTEYVTPDLGVFRVSGVWRVELNADAVPRLRINPVYAELARRSGRGREAETLRQHLTEARWLVRSLANRAETLLRVARAIVRRQEAFLEHGAEAMRPLALRDIASELDLHESTVSRVTSHKYAQTPRGVFDLKYFFSNRVASAQGNGGASATAVRARLRRIIDGEEPGQPRSDQRLASDLERAGFRVARRTVAKYRESMGIPPSNERRRAGAGAGTARLNVSA